MNERMLELAKQAEWSANRGDHVDVVAMIEKFSELIVRDCCDWINGSPTTEAGQLILTKSFIIANIKAYFGIKS